MADVRCFEGVLGTAVGLGRFVDVRLAGAVSESETSDSSSSFSESRSWTFTRRMTHRGRGSVTILP